MLLSEVLSHVRLKDTSWACFVASSPWGVSFRETKGCVRFHYVARGSCWLSIERGSQPRIALSGGDLAVLPQGHGHSIRDQPRSNPIKFDELLRRTESATPGAVHHLKVGGAGAETSMIYGAFMIDDPVRDPNALDASSGDPYHAGRGRSGAVFPPEPRTSSRANSTQIALARRSFGRAWPTSSSSRCCAHISRACPKARRGSSARSGTSTWPRRSGSCTSGRSSSGRWRCIADQVGLSRSAFAARFAELVGEPPLGYLTRLRMQRASILLREGATLAKASQMTGYASEASFSYAFRQWAGIAPGAYRRRLRSGLAESVNARETP